MISPAAKPMRNLFAFASIVLIAMSSSVKADVFELFTEEISETVFDAAFDVGDGVNPYGVQLIAEADRP